MRMCKHPSARSLRSHKRTKLLPAEQSHEIQKMIKQTFQSQQLTQAKLPHPHDMWPNHLRNLVTDMSTPVAVLCIELNMVTY